MAIVNLPDGPGAYEGPAHIKAKKKVAQTLSDAGYTVCYEKPFVISGLPHPFWGDVCVENHNIIIELDGKSHYSKRAMAKDRWKDEHLRSIGQRVIRMNLSEALQYPEDVLTRVQLLTKAI